MISQNPHRICTWDEKAECDSCECQEVLACKWNIKGLLGFLVPALAFCLSAVFGLILVGLMTGLWWPLIVMGGFWIFFFVFFEIRILCSHCPYYARKGITLHCLANHGIIKLWQYHPEPMSGFEKTALIVCFLIFGMFPLAVEVYGIWFSVNNLVTLGNWSLYAIAGVTGGTLISIVVFFSVLMIYICPKCVNFSCPFNRVSTDKVDAYLRRNPLMREAWEKAGYKLEE